MKKVFIILSLFLSIAFNLNAQIIMDEGFESGVLDPLMSFQTAGTFVSPPGIKDNANFGSTKVFGFGRSNCGSSCFDSYQTTLIITFPSPTFVDSIIWKEMEIGGNWGSQGQVLLDDVVFSGVGLGAQPVNSNTPDASPRIQKIKINQTLTTIKFVVTDITSSSEIIIDDLQIKGIMTSYITGYEYWFNNDFANKTTQMVPLTQQLMINKTVSTTELADGINTLNFRSFDNLGKYSSIVSQFFYKKSALENDLSPKILAYEYWIDNDYENAVLVNAPILQQININELISMSSLSNGTHNFNIRFKDNVGLWSSIISSFFYKTPEQIVTQNEIIEYRYWFNDDFENAVSLLLTPNQQINLMENLDLTQKPKGIYEISFQFKDVFGRWSVVITDTIEKISLPIPKFSYSSTPHCDSAIIAFTNNSIDGNKYLWDFGDGNISDSINPVHTYYSHNTFQVSLTAIDTIVGKDSTIVIPIDVSLLKTTSAISETACGSYTAPDGQVYTSSGVKTAIISNAAGCDSIITINLTVNTVDVSVTHIQDEVVLTANATGAEYQWLDCNNGYSVINGETNQSFTATQNGDYAVEVTQNNCTDTSSCYAITNVGILENTFGSNITVFPNPTDGMLKIDMGETLAEFTISITDLSGKLLKQYAYKNTQMLELDLNVQAGIYLLTIISENKIAIIRLVKN